MLLVRFLTTLVPTPATGAPCSPWLPRAWEPQQPVWLVGFLIVLLSWKSGTALTTLSILVWILHLALVAPLRFLSSSASQSSRLTTCACRLQLSMVPPFSKLCRLSSEHQSRPSFRRYESLKVWSPRHLWSSFAFSFQLHLPWRRSWSPWATSWHSRSRTGPGSRSNLSGDFHP